jgi:hypothetical protein
MHNYWVFVIVDHKGRGAPNAAEIFENRVRKRFWALNPKAAHAKKLQQGDRVVLCMAGKYSRGFAGQAVLDSGIRKITSREREHLRGLPSKGFSHSVRFKRVKPFKQIRCLGDYRGKVPFINGAKHPRLPQGSIIKIDRSQYQKLAHK